MVMDDQATVIESDKYKINIEDNIFYCEYIVAHLDLAVAKEMVQARYKHMGNKRILVFCDIRNLKSITKEARDYLAQGDAVAYIDAAAILGNSVLSRMMFNFFLNFNKPPIPMHMFTNREEALKWLRTKRGD